MGRASLTRPSSLAAKLLNIRICLGLSQNGLIRHLQLGDELTQAEVSAFERSIRIPPLHILLLYARAVGVYVDYLIDDELELPVKLPQKNHPFFLEKRSNLL
jgi:transcriptional regulator with XRE-family HTH domain